MAVSEQVGEQKDNNEGGEENEVDTQSLADPFAEAVELILFIEEKRERKQEEHKYRVYGHGDYPKGSHVKSQSKSVVLRV